MRGADAPARDGARRDTQKSAFKCSEVTKKGGETTLVYKDPITDQGKQSKKGKLTLEAGDAGKLATVAATREAQRPAICHLGPTPAPVTVAEGLISSRLVTLAVIMRHGWLPFGCDWDPRTMPLR